MRPVGHSKLTTQPINLTHKNTQMIELNRMFIKATITELLLFTTKNRQNIFLEQNTLFAYRKTCICDAPLFVAHPFSG